LGSALCAGLARGHRVAGIDRRSPSPALRRTAAGAIRENLRIGVSDTRQNMDWRSRDEYCILNRWPVVMGNFRQHPRHWKNRHIRLNERSMNTNLEELA